MSYQGIPHDSYPPPGYGTQYPPPTAPPPTAPPPPGYPLGAPPPPPPGYQAYPPPLPHGYTPPQYNQQQRSGGYQGYFNDGYPPYQPPQSYPPTQVYHCDHYHNNHEDGCLSFLKGCVLVSILTLGFLVPRFLIRVDVLYKRSYSLSFGCFVLLLYAGRMLLLVIAELKPCSWFPACAISPTSFLLCSCIVS
ncbi:hypothetical protein KSS87_001829 [Heliosperma pusillum]|nr:hypothetical protein KSS87_001829 [Heliosperma pusillum]